MSGPPIDDSMMELRTSFGKYHGLDDAAVQQWRTARAAGTACHVH